MEDWVDSWFRTCFGRIRGDERHKISCTIRSQLEPGNTDGVSIDAMKLLRLQTMTRCEKLESIFVSSYQDALRGSLSQNIILGMRGRGLWESQTTFPGGLTPQNGSSAPGVLCASRLTDGRGLRFYQADTSASSPAEQQCGATLEYTATRVPLCARTRPLS
jgi:hypothetical protein